MADSTNRCRCGFFKAQEEENLKATFEQRSIILVVAALIATVTFQAVVNPPGGVWQDDKDGHKAGTATYANHPVPYHVFLVSNTFALSLSLVTIASLTYGYHMQYHMFSAAFCMYVTYGAAVFAISDKFRPDCRYTLLAGVLPVGVRAIQICRKCWK